MRLLKNSNQDGMTLIEIMIVIVIIGSIVAAGMTKLNNPSRALKQAVRRFAILGKDLHNKAKLFNKTYRIVIKMDEEEDVYSYWVESSTGKVQLLSEEKEIELSRLTTIQRERKQKTNSFTMDPITKTQLTLPPPLLFKSVEYALRKDPIEEGIAYIHFFPQGLVEEAAIHITDGEGLNWTIAFHPITGKTDIITKEILLKDLRKQ